MKKRGFRKAVDDSNFLDKQKAHEAIIVDFRCYRFED